MKRARAIALKLVGRIGKAPRPVRVASTDDQGAVTPGEVDSGSSWASSSFDLRSGADIREDDSTTIPAELYDELFPTPRAAQNPARKRS